MLLWIGCTHGEILKPEDLIKPLAPYATLSADTIAALRADRGDALLVLPKVGIELPITEFYEDIEFADLPGTD